MADNDDIQQLILTEVQSLRADLKGYIERVSALETQMYSLIGNGQPGRIADIEEHIETLLSWRWWMAGAGAFICTALTIGVWLIEHFGFMLH